MVDLIYVFTRFKAEKVPSISAFTACEIKSSLTIFPTSLIKKLLFRDVSCNFSGAHNNCVIIFKFKINDLSENIESTVKLFADDTSLFPVVHNNNTSAEVLNRDLKKISEWAHRWKMSVNPDVSKNAQEVVSSRTQAKSVHPDLVFNNTPVHQTHCQKHLGVYLGMKLNFKLHIKEKSLKAMKEICIIKKLSSLLPRKSLITIYKSFVRPHLDYGDLIYYQPNNESFCQQIESVQYNASLAIIGAIKETSRMGHKMFETNSSFRVK